MIEIPLDTPEDKIREASVTAANLLTMFEDGVAFIDIYHVPPIEDENEDMPE